MFFFLDSAKSVFCVFDSNSKVWINRSVNSCCVTFRCMLSSQCCKCCLFCFQLWWHIYIFLFSSNIYLYICLSVLSVSVSSADFNMNSPSSNPTCKNYQHHVGLCHPPFMQKLPKGLCVIYKKKKKKISRAGLDLDGDFFIPFLSAVFAVVLH